MYHHDDALNWYLLSACFCAQTVHLLSVFRREDQRRRFFPVDALWTLSLAMTESSPSRMPLSSTSSLCFLAPILLFLTGSIVEPIGVLRSSTCALFSFCTCILAVYSFQFWRYAENPFREDLPYNHSKLLMYQTSDTVFMICSSVCVLQVLLERMFPNSETTSGTREFVRRLGNVACVTFPFFIPPRLHMDAFSYVVLSCLAVFTIGVLFLRTETRVNKMLYVLCMSLSSIVVALYVPLVDEQVSCRRTTLVSLFHVCIAVMFTLVYYSSCDCARLRRSVNTHAFLFLLSLVTPVLAFLPLFVSEPTDLPASVPGAPLPHASIRDLHLPLNSTVQECRDAWNDPNLRSSPLKQLTLMYRTAGHPTLPGSCVVIEFGPTVNFSSLEWQLHHTTHCFDPLSSPLDGCIHEACLYRVRTASLVCVLVLFVFRLFRVRALTARRGEGEAEHEQGQGRNKEPQTGGDP